MKKLTIPILAVAVFIITAYGCGPKAKVYSCQEYSLNCELQKDRVMILPVTYDSTIIDACGYHMKDLMKKNQWYIVSTESHGLVPVSVNICLSWGTEGCNNSTNTPSVKQFVNYLYREDEKIRVETTDLSFLVPGLTEVAIIISGPNEIIYIEKATPFLAKPE